MEGADGFVERADGLVEGIFLFSGCVFVIGKLITEGLDGFLEIYYIFA